MSYTTETISPLAELKTKQHQIWSNGDYGKIAWVTVPLAERLCDGVGLRPAARSWTSRPGPATSPSRPPAPSAT